MGERSKSTQDKIYYMKKIRFLLEYIILLSMGVIIRLLPRKAVLHLGARVGDFIFYCVPVRKKITLNQLRAAFPNKSEKEIHSICRSNYQNLGMNSLEHLHIPALSKDDLIKIVPLENEDIMQRAFARNKGVIFVGGHFGNWEYLGGAVSSRGYPVSYIVADIANPYIDAMVNKHRLLSGSGVITKGMSVRGILSALKKNEGIAMLMDQDSGKNGIFIDFFDKPCSTPKGPALFALKTGAALVFVAAVRQKDGTIKGVFEDIELDYSKEPTDENIQDIMTRCTQKLESYIRKYPGQWFWMHRRWKTTPEMAADTED